METSPSASAASPSLAAFLFGLQHRVPRRAYLLWGFGLAIVKFAVDTAIVYGFTHKTWSLLGYFVPSVLLRNQGLGSVPGAMHVVLVLGALPFLWIGVSMSVRRAADAGQSPWLGLGFVIPFLNYFVIGLLGILPSKDAASWNPTAAGAYREAEVGHAEARPAEVTLPSGLRSALLGMVASLGIGLLMIWLSVYGLGAYGAALFFLTPLAMGAVSASIYNAEYTRSPLHTLAVAVAGAALTASIVLLFAIEGVFCLAMAFPISALLSMIGALIGRAIAIDSRTRGVSTQRHTLVLLALLPLLAFGESKLTTPTEREVTTTIEIAAPPEAVWPNVIGFTELPAPPEWFFRLGIAYPQRARIEGRGVGAVRHCEFSTGPFVEPITVWDEPKRLAFDVTSQPPSMQEWSPYGAINAPHIEGYLVSKGGEFRLIPLPNGHTRLEGTTHYTLAVYPEMYWVGYAEVLLHGIHYRVLSHIKGLSESGAKSVAMR
jgi:uncharacterized membrane protein YhaH (DUF805 family)